MSYEQWREDAARLSQAIPEGDQVSHTIDYLLCDVGPGGIETLPESIDYAYLDSPRDSNDFPVIDSEQVEENKPYLLSRFAGQSVLAYVVPGKALSALVLPPYNPKTPIANGLLLTHEFKHMTQDHSQTFQFRPEAIEDTDDMTVDQMRTCQQIAGDKERDAYGLNIDTLRAIDGEDFDDYLARWGAVYKIEGSPGREHAALQFQEKRFKLEPTVRRPWYPWETEGLGQKLNNKIACMPVFANSLPTPPKDTFTYELWREGKFSRSVLRSIGHMAVLERELAGKIPDAHIDELAGAIFGVHVSSPK